MRAYTLKVYGEGETPDPADGLLQGDALIRANFHIEPGELTPDKWARLFCEAVWLEGERLKNLGKLIAAIWNREDER